MAKWDDQSTVLSQLSVESSLPKILHFGRLLICLTSTIVTSTLHISCSTDYFPPHRLVPPRSIPQYQIEAFPALTPPNTLVHINTRSLAMVTYVLGPHWKQDVNTVGNSVYSGTGSGWSETDEEGLSMRIIQAGWTVLDTTYPLSEMKHIQRSKQFAAFSRSRDHIF